ncbi:MAG: glycoside hydrolase family 3 C-terminal domain-containing protein [Bacteroidetes bacterium]|nr:glycoside hydrolase family 3 C-terminal domain-containing protein [Bacteroidota bacterium]
MMKSAFLLLLLPLAVSCSDDPSGSGDPDAGLPISEKVEKLLAQMTLEEKIGQMTQVNKTNLTQESDIRDYYLGSVLSGGGAAPSNRKAPGWADMVDRFQGFALQTRLKIPILYGIDAVHGNNNVVDAVIFPHNIGLGATRDADLVKRIARVTAEEVAGAGIHWTFAPCLAVPQDERWGRTYEGFGELPNLVNELGEAAVLGLQGTDLTQNTSVLACAKHFVGDGGTVGGQDQGNVILDESAIRSLHLYPYTGALSAGVQTVMASYSSISGDKMHGSKYWLTTVLKTEKKFDGILVSDWAAIRQLPGSSDDQIVAGINAGLDMIMLPDNYQEFIPAAIRLVNSGRIAQTRVDDAVRRILTVKYRLGLWNKTRTDRSLTAQVGSDAHRQVAREAVRKSLVLLKNKNNLLPLSKTPDYLVVSGSHANNIGLQCGGWTVEWQGASGAITRGTTVFQAMRKVVPSSDHLIYTEDASEYFFASAAVIVIGEQPYAEGAGDRKDLKLPDSDVQMIKSLKASGVPVVLVLMSGRPMILSNVIDDCDAVIAAWLPGTEGDGIADVLFGDYKPTGKLSHSWPASMSQIPVNGENSGVDVLFPYGYGLTW